jgi:hypothetical protein
MRQRTSRGGKASTEHRCRASQGVRRQPRSREGASGLELAPTVSYVRGQPAPAAEAAAIALGSFCGQGSQGSKTPVSLEDTVCERARRGLPSSIAYTHQRDLRQVRHSIETCRTYRKVPKCILFRTCESSTDHRVVVPYAARLTQWTAGRT